MIPSWLIIFLCLSQTNPTVCLNKKKKCIYCRVLCFHFLEVVQLETKFNRSRPKLSGIISANGTMVWPVHVCVATYMRYIGSSGFLLILSLTSVRTPWTTLYVQNYSAFRVSVPLPYSAYRSLQSGLIGPISIDRVEKKSQCSLPDAHCFIL